MHSTKLWLWMTDVQPVGWKSFVLCQAMASHRGYNPSACSQMPDAESWISSPEQFRAMKLPAAQTAPDVQ